MCLYTKQLEPEIAKHNIKCWKFVNDWTYKTWTPTYFYNAGELEYNKSIKPKNLHTGKDLEHLILENVGNMYVINEGFYAYLNKPKCEKHTYTFRLKRNITLVRVIIPRGSEYVKGIYCAEIVASKMIIFRTRWDYIKWRLFR